MSNKQKGETRGRERERAFKCLRPGKKRKSRGGMRSGAEQDHQDEHTKRAARGTKRGVAEREREGERARRGRVKRCGRRAQGASARMDP